MSVPVLDLEGIHVAALCGDNGQGKSAILDAITWSLWGQARARTQAELIYHGEDEMHVELEFLASQGRYKVSRRFRRSGKGRQGATILELYIETNSGYEPITGNSVRETENKICDLIRMEYDTFVNSSFILQGRADMFTTSTPSRRKELLGDILGLSSYDKLAEKSRIRAREFDSLSNKLEMEISNIHRELSNKDSYSERLNIAETENENMENQKLEIETDRNELRDEIQSLTLIQNQLDMLYKEYERIFSDIKDRETRIVQHRTRLNDMDRRISNLPKLEIDLGKVNQELENAEKTDKDYDRYRVDIQEFQIKINKLKETNISLRIDMDDLRTKVDLLKEMGIEAPCPLCGHALGEEGCKHLADTYETEGKIKVGVYRQNEEEIRKYELSVNDLKTLLDKSMLKAKSIREYNEKSQQNIIQSIADAKASVDSIDHTTGILQSDEAQLNSMRTESDRLSETIPRLKNAIEGLQYLSEQVLGKEKQIDNLVVYQKNLLREIGAVQDSLKRCALLQTELSEKTDIFNNYANNKGIFDQLAIAFGRNGAQALIIEQAIPEIEQYANDLLGRMTDYRMNLTLETQRENSSGGEPRETLDIKISDELGTRNYETYSGGETFRINFALRLALSKLLSSRAGAPLPTLFIDEGFGTQDPAGLERLVEAIRIIQDDFQRIIVITHMEELKEVFPVRIEVSKTSDGSTFVIV
jgi:exonuclease SbcC